MRVCTGLSQRGWVSLGLAPRHSRSHTHTGTLTLTHTLPSSSQLLLEPQWGSGGGPAPVHRWGDRLSWGELIWLELDIRPQPHSPTGCPDPSGDHP